MIKIVIGNDSCLISEEQCKWFKTLEHAVEYLTDKSHVIELPTVIADQIIDIAQFQQLVECYQTQITNNVIDYKRPRSTLEHYLDGILDDIDGQIKTILDFILKSESVVVDFKLYQMVTNYRDTISNYITNPRMDWLMSCICESKDNLTSRIVRLGSLEIFIHLFTYLDHSQVCIILSMYGQLDMLQYAHHHGCPWNSEECSQAAKNGNLTCLQYLHDNKCPWDFWACVCAAKYGNLDCLQYAHKNGCPWNEYTCAYAAKYGHLDCLKYAHENGCPLGDYLYECALQSRNNEVIEYVEKCVF